MTLDCPWALIHCILLIVLILKLEQVDISRYFLYPHSSIPFPGLLQNTVDCIGLDRFSTGYLPDAHVHCGNLNIFWYIHIFPPTSFLIILRDVHLAPTLHLSRRCQNKSQVRINTDIVQDPGTWLFFLMLALIWNVLSMWFWQVFRFL